MNLLKKEETERMPKFEELDQGQMNAINSCLTDLFNYYQTCGTPEDFRNHRIFVELVRAKD